MMVIKFAIVAGVFMHLYTDLNILNGHWFTVAFGIAIGLAVSVYIVVFAAFQVQHLGPYGQHRPLRSSTERCGP